MSEKKNKPSFESMRENFIPPSNLDNNTNSNRTTIQQSTNANIMEQMVSYNSNYTNLLIEQLNDEFKEQKEINALLKAGDYENNSIEIEQFVEHNKDNISTQLTNLGSIFNQLKDLYKENKNLQEEKTEYRELIESDEINKIAEDMRQLKSLKNNVLLFLQQNGIHVIT